MSEEGALVMLLCWVVVLRGPYTIVVGYFTQQKLLLTTVLIIIFIIIVTTTIDAEYFTRHSSTIIIVKTNVLGTRTIDSADLFFRCCPYFLPLGIFGQVQKMISQNSDKITSPIILFLEETDIALVQYWKHIYWTALFDKPQKGCDCFVKKI